MTPELYQAILAMDSYNRGYGYGLDVVAAGASATQIGNATIGITSRIESSSSEVAAGFFAQAYTLNGQTIISYRGTDGLFSPPWGQGTGSDVWNGYGTALGAPFNDQARMAADENRRCSPLNPFARRRDLITTTGDSSSSVHAFAVPAYGANDNLRTQLRAAA